MSVILESPVFSALDNLDYSSKLEALQIAYETIAERSRVFSNPEALWAARKIVRFLEKHVPPQDRARVLVAIYRESLL